MTYLQNAIKWMFNELKAVPGLGAPAPGLGAAENIYLDAAPQEAVHPFIVVQLVGSETVNVQESRCGAVYQFLVKVVVDHADAKSLTDIAIAVNNILAGASTTNWQSQFRVNCVLDREWIQTEVIDGKTYRQAGGFYTVSIR